MSSTTCKATWSTRSEPRAKCYWALFEQLRTELGYADYLGALERYRGEYPHDPDILTVSRFLLNYPFADRLFPRALEVIEHIRQWGSVALLTDGDVVFQPRKVDRSGLSEAVAGEVLIYLHKEQELADVEKRCPVDHYVLVEDKLRILSAVKKNWGSRVTTVFVHQGHYALNQKESGRLSGRGDQPRFDRRLASIRLGAIVEPRALEMRTR